MDAVKNAAKKFLPAAAVKGLKSAVVSRKLRSAFHYDLNRYKQYSSSIVATEHQHNLRALITERYHSVEKGLSLPSPRPGFGANTIRTLLGHVDEYLTRFGADEFLETVGSVLSAYLDFNREAGVGQADVPQFDRINALLGKIGSIPNSAGVREISRQDIDVAISGVGLDFFLTRHSVRQYAPEPVETDAVEFAAAAALKSPAVCNRQFSRVYSYLERESIDKVLRVQGGANGFSDQLTGLAIITTNLRSYWNEGQRNQAWVDGGLFAMSFILGLHAQGIGTVALNWSKGPELDQKMRTTTGISQEEVIVMLVGFGRLRDEYKVATSPRQSLESVLTLDPPVSLV
ncbi:nitroreductase family protein [Rhodococcus sp. USK13]|uniref:nitroreductase family protein n=1 Tax=Rhodococcus sp. USK13 TaxID=2806442 RepID=UPI001BD00D85|nr:nitroreductase family protein [Rhodococcus sp. USK13]